MDMMRNFSPEMSEEEIARKLRTDGDAMTEALQIYFEHNPEELEKILKPVEKTYTTEEVATMLGIHLESEE